MRVDSYLADGRPGPKDLFGWQANELKDRLMRPLLCEIIPGFRNWTNDHHVAGLARICNIDTDRIPHRDRRIRRHGAAGRDVG